jgi:hypothetical protein
MIVPMRSGHTADPVAIKELIDDLRRLYPGDPDGDGAANLLHLYGAMIEAVVNVVRHAYPPGVELPFRAVQRWWMTAALDRKMRSTTAVVYDQGVTIPVTLPKWEHYRNWTRRIGRKIGIVPPASDTKSDGEAIAAAVEESLTSSGESHRGTGLAQMRHFVDQCQGGRLRIMSRCGEVVFRPGKDPEVRTYDVSVGGTLIEWSVLL